MTIGDLSKKTGITQYTLRYYEKLGLIRVERDEGGRRSYLEEDLEWVRFIQRLKDTGMQLRNIKKYSQLRYQGDNTMEERLHMLEEHQLSVIDELKKWESYRENLNAKINIYKEALRLSSK